MGNQFAVYTHRIKPLALLFAVCVAALAQNQERPKLKDFGSSLKRVKWDDGKKTAIETQPASTATRGSEDSDVVRVETSLVSNDVMVLDARGDFVQGLTEKDFVIAEEGTPQQVGMFSPGDNVKVPRSIVLIIDYSSSQRPFIKTSVAAAKMLVDKLSPLDSMAIVTDDVKLIQDFTRDKDKLKHKLDSLLGGVGRSKQYSALFATLREAFNAEDQRPIVIFQTDGDQLGALRNTPLTYRELPAGLFDKRITNHARQYFEENRTDFSLDDIYRAAEKARATIYTVIPGPKLLGRPLEDVMAGTKSGTQKIFDLMRETLRRLDRPPMEDVRLRKLVAAMTTDEQLKRSAEDGIKLQAALDSVATSTGGWTMFLETPDDADHIYSSIFSDINRRYIVGYYPTNKSHDGKRRKIDVTVRDHPDYVVVGRRWYYAPAPDR